MLQHKSLKTHNSELHRTYFTLPLLLLHNFQIMFFYLQICPPVCVCVCVCVCVSVREHCTRDLCQFLADVNSRSRSLYAIADPSVCRLSSVYDVGAPYSAG